MTNRQLQDGINQTAELKTRLVFFDMDHTILNASKYHRQSFIKSLNKLFGIGITELPRVMISGYPYLEVVRRYANACGISDEFYDSKQSELTGLLVENMLACIPPEMSDCVYPGTVRLLEKLRQANVAIGITTGTMRDIAVPLLQRSGLLPYFPLMAFGDQTREREQILQKALDQAPWVYGLDPDEVQLVTVGDAVKDITAGKAFGAVTIAVANGVTSMEQLSEFKPDFLFANLEETEAIFAAIVSGSTCN